MYHNVHTYTYIIYVCTYVLEYMYLTGTLFLKIKKSKKWNELLLLLLLHVPVTQKYGSLIACSMCTARTYVYTYMYVHISADDTGTPRDHTTRTTLFHNNIFHRKRGTVHSLNTPFLTYNQKLQMIIPLNSSLELNTVPPITSIFSFEVSGRPTIFMAEGITNVLLSKPSISLYTATTCSSFPKMMVVKRLSSCTLFTVSFNVRQSSGTNSGNGFTLVCRLPMHLQILRRTAGQGEIFEAKIGEHISDDADLFLHGWIRFHHRRQKNSVGIHFDLIDVTITPHTPIATPTVEWPVEWWKKRDRRFPTRKNDFIVLCNYDAPRRFGTDQFDGCTIRCKHTTVSTL